MQVFKGDATELKMIASAEPTINALNLQKDLFFAAAYEADPLGDVIYDFSRSPLANAIDRNLFRISFNDIFDAFVVAGSFESYLTVFRKIFGSTVGVVFTVPAPGKLNIDITADSVELSDFISRTIQNNLYVFEEIVDEESDNIAFQTVKGFKTQYELEQMLFEMVPAGIFTMINLDLA